MTRCAVHRELELISVEIELVFDLLRRLDRQAEAAAAYRDALALTSTEAERRYLNRRLAEASAAG